MIRWSLGVIPAGLFWFFYGSGNLRTLALAMCLIEAVACGCDILISGQYKTNVRSVLSRLHYSFGPYLLVDSGRLLQRNGETVAATPKVRAILLVLVRAGGKAVSKEELLSAVWPDSFVEEGNLTQSISVLRKLLARDYPDESPIETIARFGYRFSVAVAVHDAVLDGDHVGLPTERGEDLDRTGFEPAFTPAEAALASPVVSADETAKAVAVALAPAARVKGAATFRSSWLPWLIPASLLFLVLGWMYVHHAGSVKKSELDFVQFSSNTNENRVTAAAISPDGGMVAYAAADGVVLRGEHDLATHSLPTPDVRQIERLAWSPDGLHLLMSGSSVSGVQQLWMLSTTGGAPTMLRDHARLGTISPDGSMVAFVTDERTEVWVAGLGGEDARMVFSGSPNDTFPVILWSADGKKLLLERHTAFQSDGHFHSPRTEDEIEGFHPTYLAIDPGTGDVTAAEDNIRIGDACLSAADRMLFSRSEETDYGDWTSFWRVGINPKTGGFTSAPERIRDFDSMRLVTLSASLKTGGMAAVFSHGRAGIYVGALNVGKGRLENVKLLTAGHGGPHGWTPDSSAVLFESNHADLDHHYHIYKQQWTRHEPEILTPDMGGESLPRMTPKPHSILFQTKTKDGIASIWRLGLAGERPVLIDNGRSLEYRCPLSGTVCLLAAPLNSLQFAFWALDPMHGRGQKLFTMPASWNTHGDWDVSPDGQRVAAVSQLSSQPEIHVAELATGTTQELLLPIKYPVEAINWMPDGNGWIIATSTGLGHELLYVDAKGTPKLLRETRNSTWGVPSPDGSKLAFADQDVDSNVWLLRGVR